MNVWTCNEPGCRQRANGEGGAIGLTALGWFYRLIPPAPVEIWCPNHHPDGSVEARKQALWVQHVLKRLAEPPVDAAIRLGADPANTIFRGKL